MWVIKQLGSTQVLFTLKMAGKHWRNLSPEIVNRSSMINLILL